MAIDPKLSLLNMRYSPLAAPAPHGLSQSLLHSPRLPLASLLKPHDVNMPNKEI